MNIISALKKTALLLGVLIALQFMFASNNAALANNTAQLIYDNAVGRLCWTCPALGTFYEASVVLGYQISQDIVGPLRGILGGALGLWLLWHIVKIFMPFGSTAGIGEVFNKIASRLALFIFLLAFLSNTGFGLFWEYIISPIYVTGISLSTKVLEKTAASTGIFAGTIGGACDYNVVTFTGIDSLTNIGTTHREDIKEAGRRMMCLANDVQKVMGVGAAMGVMGMMLAGSDLKVSYSEQKVGGGRFLPEITIPIPDIAGTISALVKMIMMFVAGIVLAIVFVLAILIYPIYLLDAMFRLGIIIVISPILISAYLFELTRGWAVQAVKMLVGIAATLFFQSIIVGLSVSIINATISEVGNGAATINDFLANTAVKATFAFYDGVTLVWFSFFASGFLVLYMMKSASKIAQEFVGMGAGDEVRGGVVGAIQKAATLAAYAGAAVATGGASAAAGAATALPEPGAIGGAGPSAGPGPGGLGTGGGPPPGGGPGPGPGSGSGGIGGVLSSKNWMPAPSSAAGGTSAGGTPAPSGGGSSSASTTPSSSSAPSASSGLSDYGSTITGPGFSGSVMHSATPGQATLGPLPAGFGSNMPTGNFAPGSGKDTAAGAGQVTITGPVTATGTVNATGGVNVPTTPPPPPPPPTAHEAGMAAARQVQNASHSAAQAVGLDGTTPSSTVAGSKAGGGVGGAGFAGGGSASGGSEGEDRVRHVARENEELRAALARQHRHRTGVGSGKGTGGGEDKK